MGVLKGFVVKDHLLNKQRHQRGDVAVHEGLKGWRIWNRIFFDSQNRKSKDTLEKYGQLQEFGV